MPRGGGMRGAQGNRGQAMDWYITVFELIDMRSFSNLWFWIALAVLWSTVSHWVLGVPWDLVIRARKQQGQALEDMETLVRINVDRTLYIARESGLLLAAFGFFLLTVLVLMGFVYKREFAQAVFLLGVPVGIVWLLSVATATRIEAQALEGEALIKRLHKHRTIVQLIGVVSIFITAMWGMLQNLSASVLGI